MEFPAATSVDSTPSFTVLIPHYSEKVLLDFAEITTQEKDSTFTILEYLQSLYATEWENFSEECRKYIAEHENEENGEWDGTTMGGSSFGSGELLSPPLRLLARVGIDGILAGSSFRIRRFNTQTVPS